MSIIHLVETHAVNKKAISPDGLLIVCTDFPALSRKKWRRTCRPLIWVAGLMVNKLVLHGHAFCVKFSDAEN